MSEEKWNLETKEKEKTIATMCYARVWLPIQYYSVVNVNELMLRSTCVICVTGLCLWLTFWASISGSSIGILTTNCHSFISSRGLGRNVNVNLDGSSIIKLRKGKQITNYQLHKSCLGHIFIKNGFKMRKCSVWGIKTSYFRGRQSVG